MPFKAHYEFDVSGTRAYSAPRTVICCDGMPHGDGEGSLNFWLETRHRETINFDTGDVTPAHVENHGSQVVYSWALVTFNQSKYRGKLRQSLAPWLLREMVVALAKGHVAGDSGGHMLYTVFFQTVAKEAPDWLTKNAPEWWALVDPKKQRKEVKG
jgi:hypothetical protein